MNKSLYIFTRDLRIEDNTALYKCFKESSEVLCCFIFTPEQVGNANKYISPPAIKFMIQSLEDLQAQLETISLKLYYYHNSHVDAIARLHEKYGINAVYHTIDYTPYARMRDLQIKEWCAAHNVKYNCAEDNLIPLIGEKLPAYKKFTPFYNAAKTIPVAKAVNHKAPRNIDAEGEPILATPEAPSLPGGRSSIDLDKVLHIIRNYDNRDNLSVETTMLSPYLKFGCIGVREIYRLARTESFIRQLYWREFYYRIVWHKPAVLGGPNRNFNENYRKIRWRNKLPDEWKIGRTGFPIVDAGMRQLLSEGYMHNRARLITASFLVKDLHVDWQLGEKYFAQNLVDYDPAQNNGNWQWVAGSGVDSQPYFRIFNPWLQSKHYDADATYIHKYIPELREVPSEHLHEWNLHYRKYPNIQYPPPMIEHDTEKDVTMHMYERLNK